MKLETLIAALVSIMMASSKDLMMYNMFAKQSAVRFAITWILYQRWR